MYQKLIVLVGALSFAFSQFFASEVIFAATPSRIIHNSKAKQITVHFCVLDKTAKAYPATVNVFRAVRRFTYNGYIQGGIKINGTLSDDPTCLAQSGAGCFGAPAAVYCNLMSLSDVLDRMAWVIGDGSFNMFADAKANKKIIFEPRIDMDTASRLTEAYSRENSEQGGIDALKKIGDEGVDVDEMLKAVIFRNNILLFDANPDSPEWTNSPEVGVSYSIYEAATNYLFAYILGHEFAHAYGSCLYSKPSALEASGQFSAIITAQSGGKIFNRNPLVIDEVLADRCGLRSVQAMDVAMIAFKRSHPDTGASLRLLEISKRMAIDGFSIIIATGFGETWSDNAHWFPPGSDGLPTTTYSMDYKSGYIYPGLRLALFAELLARLSSSPNPSQIRICDDTAKRFVIALNRAAKHFPFNGENQAKIDQRGFPELFGSIVGPGVVKGWRTGAWDESTSFVCE